MSAAALYRDSVEYFPAPTFDEPSYEDFNEPSFNRWSAVPRKKARETVIALPAGASDGGFSFEFLDAWQSRADTRSSDFNFIKFLAAPVDRDDPNHAAIEAQVEDRRLEAAEEGEDFSETSAAALLRFCHKLAADIQPAIVRLANGNLRAIWQNAIKDQIGIQFLPNGELQYIILRDRRGRTYKSMGVETAETIDQIVGVLGLKTLWFHG